MSTDPNSHDADLLRAARNDPDAFSLFYRQHAARIHGWLSRETGSPDLATDLTAETFAQALLGLRRFRGREEGSGTAWLFGIGHNLLRRHRRKGRVEHSARRRLGMSLEPYQSELTPESIDERLSAAGQGPALRRAIVGLPAGQRAAIELRVLQDLPYDEVAERLGCTPTTARMRVSRGLRAMHDEIEGALS